MTMTADDLGVLGDLAEAIGLTDDGSFRADWLSDPGGHMARMLARQRQREALLAFVDEVLGGSQRSTGPDGSVWLPIAEATDPTAKVYLVVDDRGADSVALGLGVRVSSTAPQASLSVHVPIFRAAKEGHSVASPLLLGTPQGRATLALDITLDAGAAIPGQAHLGGIALDLQVPTGAGGAAPQFGLRLRGLQLPGAPAPRDLNLSVSDLASLEASALELVLGLARAQAAALGAGPLAALAGLLGLRDGIAVPPLPLQDLAHDGVTALAHWLGGLLQAGPARAAWLGQLAALFGAGAAVVGEQVTFPLGPLRLTVSVPAAPGSAGLVRIRPTVGIEWPAQPGVWLRGEAVLCSLDLGSGSATALPLLALNLLIGQAAGGAVLIDAAGPPAVRVASLRAGFGLDAQRRPTLVLAADGVRIGTHDHGTLDLSSPDAIAAVGATVLDDVADEVLDRLGPAADAVRVLLGLSAPAGHPEVTAIGIATFLQNPLEAIRAYWLGVVRDHASVIPTILAELRGLVADAAAIAQPIDGDGTPLQPWRLTLVGPVVLQAWKDGDHLKLGPAVRFVVDDIGQRCTRLETRIAMTLIDADLASPGVQFLGAVELALALRARGRNEAVIDAGVVKLRADQVVLAARWSPAAGLAVALEAPNLAIDYGGQTLPVPIPTLGAGGRIVFTDADWAALEELLATFALAAAPPWLDDVIGLFGWRRDPLRPAGSRAARLRLAALVADPAIALRDWLRDALLGDHELIRHGLDALATLLTGARDGVRGILLGSGSPRDPWRVVLGRAGASAEFVAWVGPDGPAPLLRAGFEAFGGWGPGQPGLDARSLVQALGDHGRAAGDVAAQLAGRDELAAGLDALVARWSGTDGRVLPPAVDPPGVNIVRLAEFVAPDLLDAVDLESLLGAVPATVVYVAVAAHGALPFADVVAERVMDLTTAGLQASAFTPPAPAAGAWFVVLGGRDACRNASGDEDGVQGQADRLARVLAAFAGLGGGLAVVADAASGHAARRAAEATPAVTALITAGTPLGPVSLQVLDTAPAADALRLLARLLPEVPGEDSELTSDDPDLHLGRGLVDALMTLAHADDPARELRAPTLAPAAPRAGLAVHMLFGQVNEDAVRRAITAVVVGGLLRREAQRAAVASAAPDRLVFALRAHLDAGAPALGAVTLDGHAQLVLATLRVDGAALRLDTARELHVDVQAGRRGGWLVGGPDPGRAPGQPQPHHLRRVSLALALPLAEAGAADASITLYEARVFDLERERWRLQASTAPAIAAGFDAATTLLPEARVLLGSLATALGAETSGPGAALKLLLTSLEMMDAAGGSVPDAIEHVLNDARAALSSLVAQPTSRDKLIAALRALWPQLPSAAPGEVAVSAGPLEARVSFAPWRVAVVAAGTAGSGGFGWFDWQTRLAVDASGVTDGGVSLGATGATVAGGVRLELNRALRLALRWSRPGAAQPDEIELWPHPNASALEAALVRLVPAELTRLALEGLRALDDSARPVVDAALSITGLLGSADAHGARRVLLPAALFADPVSWLRSEAALGAANAFVPARLVTLFDALRPLLGVTGAGGSWTLAPGVTLRAEADASGSARLALALDSGAFTLPAPGIARLAFGGAFSLALPAGAAPRAGVEIFAGLPSATAGRSAVHVVLTDGLSVFLRPAVGDDVALFPNPAGLGRLVESAVTQALPLVLDGLADMQPQAGIKGQVGTLVLRIGDAMALRSAGHFQAAALTAWANDPAAALAARLPSLLAAALDGLAQAIGPLLPGGASASFSGGLLHVTAGGFELTLRPAPLQLTVHGALAGLPVIDHAQLGLTLDPSGLASFELQVGPAVVAAGGVTLRPAFSVVAGTAPIGGARALLTLGLPGDRLVGARWLIGSRFDLVLVTSGSESTDLEHVALGLLEAVLDLVASFVMRQAAVTLLLAKEIGTGPAKRNVQKLLRGALLVDADGPAQLIAQPFDLALLLGRLQRLAANVAGANPSITIDNALTIGLAGADLGGGVSSVGVRVSLPRPAKLGGSDVVLSLETDARWIHPPGGAVPDGIVIDLLHVGPGVGAFAFVPGISVNGVGLRIARDGRPLLDTGSFSVGSVALNVFAQFSGSARAGGAQIQLSELAAGVGGAGGGNGVAQGILGDSGSGPNRLAPAFSPALAIQKHGSGPVLVSLRAGDGTGPWWLAIQRGFGPLYIEQVGFGVTLQSDQLKSISVLLDGRVSLLGLTAAVDDLQLTFVVASDASVFDASRWAVDLAGLAFNADMGGLTLQGGLRKFGSGDNVQYVGMLMGRFAVYGLSVFGGYGQGTVNGQRFASFFAFGAINGPIGGPPAFFLTGIGGGLGINRQLVLPSDLSRFDQYPLIKALDPSARPSDDPMAELIRLGDTFPMQRGSFWFAAGVSFTSFALVDGVVVLSVQVGDGLEIALLGLARMALPRPQVAIVSIELGLVARFSSKEGVLWVQAQLTDNSWLLYPDVRLTGGFAFVVWFAGPNRGQFVLTIGGYHPNFRRAGYPEVPRLGLQWRVGPFIAIKGESYFALTSEAVMAGVRVEVSATFGPAWAQVIFGADGIVFFDPFHFEVQAYASIRAGVTIDVWIGEITISISISARIMVEGPEFHGIATFSVGPVDLAVEFGNANQPPRPLLPWAGFVTKYLEEAQPGVARVLAAVAGKGALPPGAGPGGATDTATADGSAEKPFEVYAEFEITLTNSVPTRRVELGAARVLEHTPSHSIGLAPMGLSDVNTVLHVELTRDGVGSAHIDAMQAEVRSTPSFPLGVWGPVQNASNPKLPSGDVLEAIDTLRLFTVANIPPGLPPIDYRKRVEVGKRLPLPFVTEHAIRPDLLAAAAGLRALVPAVANDEATFVVASQWAARAGASFTSLASLRGERAAPPRLGSLTDGLAIDTAAPPPIALVEPGQRAAVNTHVRRPLVVAVLSTGLDEPERAAQRTTVAQPPQGVKVVVGPPMIDEVAALTSVAVPAVLHRINATRGTVQGRTLVAADNVALTRMARAPLAAVRGRGATREVRERIAALNGSLLDKPGARGAITAGATLAAGEVVLMALPNAARDLDEKTPRPRLSVTGADARLVALRHGGEVLADVELPAKPASTFTVPQCTERIAVAIGTPAAQQRPGLAGWHSGSVLPSLGHGCALAAQAVVQVEGRVRAQRVHGLTRESGWLRAAELVEGTALVSTRFAQAVTLIIVALDDATATGAGRGLTLGLDGATRRLDALGEPLPATVVVRGQRSLLLYEVEPLPGHAVTASVASEDGWHLVGVMAAAPDADVQAVAAQLAQRGIDLLVRGAVAPGTQQARLGWLPATRGGREIAEPDTRATPRKITPVPKAPPLPRHASRRAPKE